MGELQLTNQPLAALRDRVDNSGRQVLWALGAFVLIAIAMIWIGAIAASRQDRATTLEGWTRESSNLVRALEEHTTRTMHYVDEIALQVKTQYEKQGARFDMVKFFEDTIVDRRLFLVAVISDATGASVMGSLPNFTPVNLADREHIQVHVERDIGTLFISKPVLARVARRWSIVATRRINKPDGSYGGVVGIGIDPFYFTSFYKEVSLGKNSVVALVGMDGVVRARLSDTGSDVGQDIRNSEFLNRAHASRAGIYSAVAKVDGVKRLNNYRVLRDYPLIVNVGVAEDVIYADSSRRSFYYYGGAAFMTLVIMLMAVPLWAANARSAKANAAIKSMNASLARQADQLTTANQALESFSYSVAHDLRSPLRAINGYTAIILATLKGTDDPATAHNLQQVMLASERMGRLIDDLLALAQLSKQEMGRQEFSLSDVAAEVAESLRKAQPGRSVQVTIEPAMTASGDPGLLRIALENLIGNAWKFTAKAAAATIEIGTQRRGGQVNYYVRDNGAGFDMRYVDNLFKPFQRLHRADEFEGTGIGLATVQKIIQRHDGKIEIESVVNHGTTVYFSLGEPA